MRERGDSIFANIDWFTVILYVVLVGLGWGNIYAAVYDERHNDIFDLGRQHGKQLMFIGIAFILAMIIIIVDASFYTATAYFIYGGIILLNVAVIFFGDDVKGSHSWFKFGNFSVQPAEFAKFAVGLVLAKVLTEFEGQSKWLERLVIASGIVLIPIGLCFAQSEAGVALVFFSFIILFYREGLIPGWLIMNGLIVLILALLAIRFRVLADAGQLKEWVFVATVIVAGVVTFALTWFRRFHWMIPLLFTLLVAAVCVVAVFWLGGSKKLYLILAAVTVVCCLVALRLRFRWPVGVILGIFASLVIILTPVGFLKLKPHQQVRLRVFLRLELSKEAKRTVYYNLNQSMIAIGSGGATGKGYLQGTQTKFDFVPEQETDFIFCTVGEEWGFLGSSLVLILFATLIIRIVFMAERQRSPFGRIYGYAIAGIFFFHLLVNVGMTMNLVPVIGIPLPFFSYGGSSLLAFTILLFIFIRLDSERLYILR